MKRKISTAQIRLRGTHNLPNPTFCPIPPSCCRNGFERASSPEAIAGSIKNVPHRACAAQQHPQSTNFSAIFKMETDQLNRVDDQPPPPSCTHTHTALMRKGDSWRPLFPTTTSPQTRVLKLSTTKSAVRKQLPDGVTVIRQGHARAGVCVCVCVCVLLPETAPRFVMFGCDFQGNVPGTGAQVPPTTRLPVAHALSRQGIPVGLSCSLAWPCLRKREQRYKDISHLVMAGGGGVKKKPDGLSHRGEGLPSHPAFFLWGGGG